MSTVASPHSVRRPAPPSFYFWVAFVMAFFVFGGFSLAALQRYLTNAPTQMPPVVHLHGVTSIGWMTLLMVQTYLINVKNVALHRSLGTFGIALGTAVLFTGGLITLLGMSNGICTTPSITTLMMVRHGAFGIRVFVHAGDASSAQWRCTVGSFCSRRFRYCRRGSIGCIKSSFSSITCRCWQRI